MQGKSTVPARGAVVATLATACALLLAPDVAGAASCPDAVDPGDFASAKALRNLVTQENGFGDRFLASRAHRRTIGWIADEIRRADDDFQLRSDHFGVWRWLPKTKAERGPGLDLARAGGLQVERSGGDARKVPVAGAVRWSQPTPKRGGDRGELVYLGPDEEITPENSAGKVVIRDFPSGSIPYIGFQLIGLYVTPDLASETGSYERPFINTAHEELMAASAAGAAGVIFTFDVPREQVAGYGDPHVGTIYRTPAVFVGDRAAARLKALAEQGGSARVSVRAKVDRAQTRNLIATLPGRSRERIILATNTDGQSWVQEDGVSGILAFARYYADLPLRCRPRTLQIAFASAHDALVDDGTDKYAEPLDAEYGKGSIAFAFAVEHLGTREILPEPDPDGSGERLAFTGKGEPFLFAAGDSDALREAAVATTKARDLDRTAVLQGIGVPEEGRVPPICSMGGLGIAFHGRLIPTLAMISGPWSLYAPSFGRSAIDFGRMRSQLLTMGDSILSLDDLPWRRIAGDYPEMREQRDQGAPTCPVVRYPHFAPGPGR